MGCSLFFWFSWDRVLPSEWRAHLCTTLPSSVFSSMKIAIGEDSASILGPCPLDTCRSECSKGQLPSVHWLLFEVFLEIMPCGGLSLSYN